VKAITRWDENAPTQHPLHSIFLCAEVKVYGPVRFESMKAVSYYFYDLDANRADK
jgi:hypothetical protein